MINNKGYLHTRGIILEGLSCSGKTSLFNAIKKLHGNSYERTLIAFSENYTQILYRQNNTLISLNEREHYDLLTKRVECIKELGEWGDFLGPASIASRGVFVMLERFHLNHKNRFPLSNISQLEEDINRCNLKTVLLTISPDRVYDRLLHRNRGDIIKSKREIQEYIKEQNNYITLSKESPNETYIINTDDMDWDRIADDIMKLPV